MNATDRVSVSPFDTTADGRAVTKYTLTNARGSGVDVIDFGATITAVRVADRDGKFDNVTLAYDRVAGYEGGGPYFGATVGRYANRIAKGRFDLNGKTYTLAVNNGPNALHGGVVGFDKRVWAAEPIAGESAVRFTLHSPDGDEGYPSAVDVSVLVTLTDKDELRLDYTATNVGDLDTVVNLTNHAYFNLAGTHRRGTILDHVFSVPADEYLVSDADNLVTGEVRRVDGTPYDFREPRAIGERIDAEPSMYDSGFVLGPDDGQLREAGEVVDATSGRVLRVRTTEPSVHLYTGFFLDGGASSGGFPQHGGLCLETQHYPDSPNQPSFPSTTLAPGKTYTSTTIFEFSHD